MMPFFLPGNFAMMLLMGNLPAGVCAVNLSCSTSTPFSLDWMYCSSFSCAGLPAGREPNATTSLVYCRTFCPSIFGVGTAAWIDAAEGADATAALADAGCIAAVESDTEG